MDYLDDVILVEPLDKITEARPWTWSKTRALEIGLVMI